MQLAIFTEPSARRSDAATSHQAAASLPPCGALETSILECFAGGGLTDEEVCERLPHLYSPTVKTCRSRLTKRGLLVPSGRRPSSRGRDMTVWAAVPATETGNL